MINKNILILSALCSCCSLWADEVVVRHYNYAGPYEVKKPFLADSLDVNSKRFSDKELLNTTVPFCNLSQSGQTLDAASSGELTLPTSASSYALHLVSFYLNSDRYTKGTLRINGPEISEVYVDGQLTKLTQGEASLTLEPRRYEIVIKYLSESHKENALKASFNPEKDAVVTTTINPEKRYTLSDVFDGKRIQSASLSPNGKFIIVSYQETYPGGKQSSFTQILDKATGSVLVENGQSLRWMPKSNLAYYTRKGMKGTELVTLDPTSKKENILACQLPEGSFSFGPTEDYLLFSIREKGPQERKEIQEILVPDDRQPGWRNRMFIHKYDLRIGLFQRLTYGHTSTYINDISQDGHYLLFSRREPNLTERPFSRTYIYKMDLRTMHVDTLIKGEKFVSRAVFSPDATQLLVDASGEAFDGIGLKIKEGQTSNTSDGQLFLYNIADKSIKPLTKNFDPSVDSYEWNALDKQIYITAKDKDRVRMYSLNPSNGKIKQLQAKEDVISDYSIANQAFEMVYFGLSASNSQRLYTYNLKNDASSCLIDLSKEILRDVTLGEVQDWNFVSAQGDTIYGRFYLPPHFDATKKYPMIVNYYGGTTPTARVMESRYPSHVYAGLGYIVYIIQPSGATGFGQEFSARHVNAWGKLTADEIIEGTKKFCEEHPFVNTKKIGCMGASYGGFMTQYLQTKTDIFAAAMSHAGISDITSYWGEGYWGYSYSSLASANSYPWNARDMYTLQSPLFNADKINTPILFLHGTADTNVPIGESIQMFTALKLLGKPTAFVQVEGENHHILDYDKRILWNNTIYAWFAKWLKDQPEWWDALYPPKSL